MKGLMDPRKNKMMILMRGAFELLCYALPDPKYWDLEKMEIFEDKWSFWTIKRGLFLKKFFYKIFLVIKL